MIEVQEATKYYGGTAAVREVSFTVVAGRVTGFLGPNGSGKSTTMRMILALDRPTRGRVLVAGRPYRDLTEPLRTVGALLDAGNAHGGRRARDHLAMLAACNGIARRRVDEVLELVGLASVARRRVRGFSLGMLQRLGIAAALLGDPAVLILDEPMNGLDTEGIRWLRQLLIEMAAQGRTVLLSSHVPVLDGLAATRRITEAGHPTRIIMLTTFDLDEYVYTALGFGASGFLLKDASTHTLAEAVRAVARGDAMLAPTVTRRLLERFAHPGAPHPPLDRHTSLTARETDVLVLIARGLSNAEIASELVISEQTVKTHVGRILDKLHLRDRTQAAIYAYESRLIQPG